ncbi:MAG: SMC-Scp complex subunit ScpB [Gammaproteobacteria bacterium]
MNELPETHLRTILEAALFSAAEPVSIEKLSQLFPNEQKPSPALIRQALQGLAQDYEERGIALQEVASGYRFQVRAEMAPWLERWTDEKPARYSRALLETLALISYRQPITRAEVEEVRGVTVSSTIIRNLLDREWIKIVGHREVPGRPALYATTKVFLDYFNLKSLSELPALAQIEEEAETL